MSFIRRIAWNFIRDRILFHQMVQERYWREQFYYNAFKALSFNAITGDYAEFGSHGVTFAMAFRQARRHRFKGRFWAFDSFEGLPQTSATQDQHQMWQAGRLKMTQELFHSRCSEAGLRREDYEVVPGYFEASLRPENDSKLPKDIALAYIDCDMYSSTTTVLDFLKPRLKQGMLIAFDDYHCWSATGRSGERQAALEFTRSLPDWDLVPHMNYGWAGASFVVEARS